MSAEDMCVARTLLNRNMCGLLFIIIHNRHIKHKILMFLDVCAVEYTHEYYVYNICYGNLTSYLFHFVYLQYSINFNVISKLIFIIYFPKKKNSWIRHCMHVLIPCIRIPIDRYICNTLCRAKVPFQHMLPYIREIIHIHNVILIYTMGDAMLRIVDICKTNTNCKCMMNVEFKTLWYNEYKFYEYLKIHIVLSFRTRTNFCIPYMRHI